MSEVTEWLMIAALGGFLVGSLFGRWVEASIWRGKCGDSVGHRTAMCSGGKFYYVVTEREYVNKVMAPLPDGTRVEIGDNFVRFTNMPKDPTP